MALAAALSQINSKFRTDTKECERCRSVDFTLCSTEKVNFSHLKTAFFFFFRLKPFSATFHWKVGEDAGKAAKRSGDAAEQSSVSEKIVELRFCGLRPGLVGFQELCDEKLLSEVCFDEDEPKEKALGPTRDI